MVRGVWGVGRIDGSRGEAEARRRGEREVGVGGWENGFAITSLAAKNAKSAKGWGLYFLVLDLLEEVAFASGR